ncbi:MAG: methyltransferase domain-containing protein [Bryobacterales bacterium]|nr:methyltransferase domain-containing protein [Bryobacterales bacterium]
MYVQYGCGLSAPREWTNFDSSVTLKWERIPVLGKLGTKNAQRFPRNVIQGDIVKGLPVPEASCSGVYASHVLEHLTLNEFHIAVRNTKRLLRPGGIFRMLVPDLEWAAREYLRRLESRDLTANQFFLEETCLGKKDRVRGLHGAIYNSLATSAHGWMWDSLSLTGALDQHGFQSVRKCSFGDCDDPMFALVEDVNRFEHAVAMEARA